MNSIKFDLPEEEKMYDWAKQNGGFGFSSDDKETYFTPVTTEESDAMEYTPQNFPDFNKIFGDLWQNDDVMKEIIRVCAVACMKGKPQDDKPEYAEATNMEGDAVPTFVYAF